MNEDTFDAPDDRDEYFYINRGWANSVLVGLVGLLAGTGLGFALTLTGIRLGSDQAAAALSEVLVNQGSGVAQAQPTAQPTALPARVDNVSADDDPFLGAADAPVTIVAFSDFHCPYCQSFDQTTLPSLLEKYGDQIRFVFRDFPAVGGEQAALAADCANAQGDYWAYHDALFARFRQDTTADDFVNLAVSLGMDGDSFRQCYESGQYADEVSKDYSDGRSYGVTGTPTFFINGVRVIGAQPSSVFEQVIDQELASAGS